MRSGNKIILASAGSGKTTSIVGSAGKDETGRSALITYTNKNSEELREKAKESFGFVPVGMTVSTWYRFLLRHFIRPYQRSLYQPRVDTLVRVDGRSAKFIGEANIERHYFLGSGEMYMDKASKFACAVIVKTEGAPIDRFAQIFDHLYIDEVQDLAGWDLELVEFLLKSKVSVTLVGDIRQATYRTNPAAKNSQYAGIGIIRKFDEWCKAERTVIEHQSHSYRCVQEICDFADQFFPDFPKTESRNSYKTCHDGVFAVRKSDVGTYMNRFDPQPLRLKRTNAVLPGNPLNYGESKGKGFQRTLIFPHGNLLKVLETGDVAQLGSSNETRAKVYVGITRAHQSVGFVIPDRFVPAKIPIFL